MDITVSTSRVNKRPQEQTLTMPSLQSDEERSQNPRYTARTSILKDFIPLPHDG